MCGICGKVDLVQPLPAGLIEAMTAAMLHRGPDDGGTFADSVPGPDGRTWHIGLGHRRLSIIDLSAAGHQPMTNERGDVWLVFNGEIYNFAELRAHLLRAGHAFHSRTDTEVIIHGYEEWGVEVLLRLRGMFALGLWDRPRRLLLLARDRLGKKPLFYSATPAGLAFASEVAALLQDGSIDRTPDPLAIHDYLTYQYVPPPGTGFRGVRKLPAAHYLLWEGGEPKVVPYWRLEVRPRAIAPEDARRELLAQLTEAVRLRLVSDVPLGAFLSGGVDSSAIVAIMKQVSPGPVKTFTVGFEEGSFDEREQAREVAQLLGTEHHEFVARPDAAALLPLLVRHYGELYSDSSALPTYYLARVTRQHVTVALSGDAGDENFAGYDRYLAYRLLSEYRRLPQALRRAVARAVAALPQSTDYYSPLHRLRRFVEAAASQEPELSYLKWICHFDDGQKAELYQPGMAAAATRSSSGYLRGLFEEYAGAGNVEKLMAVDIVSYLPYDLLAKVDVASMANSLEVRCPFLDHHLVEFAASLPLELKLRGMTKKWILKSALEGMLPQRVLHRRKHGFGVPVGGWFRGPLKDYAAQVLLDPHSLGRGYFRPQAVERLLSRHASGEADHGMRIWSLLVLEMWHREFVDPGGSAASGGGMTVAQP